MNALLLKDIFKLVSDFLDELECMKFLLVCKSTRDLIIERGKFMEFDTFNKLKSGIEFTNLFGYFVQKNMVLTLSSIKKFPVNWNIVMMKAAEYNNMVMVEYSIKRGARNFSLGYNGAKKGKSKYMVKFMEEQCDKYGIDINKSDLLWIVYRLP